MPADNRRAGVAKLVDALGLGPSGATLESSSLSARTPKLTRKKRLAHCPSLFCLKPKKLLKYKYNIPFMFNFLHNFQPPAILLSWGPIHIYWYGLFIVLGILAAIVITKRLAKKYGLSEDLIFDLAFWLIIAGLVGARIYDILLELPYYLNHPGQMLRVWEGGLAIHGAIIAGLIVTVLFARRHKLNFWQLTAAVTPGLAIGQAIGRWGNYFNQELFGLPTEKWWGIPINLINRPAAYISSTYFHPTFLYESLGCLIIGITLLLINYNFIKRGRNNRQFYVLMTALYMILYSILRFTLEFIKIDTTPTWLGLRWPQIMSLLIIIVFSILIFFKKPSQNHA